VKLLLDTGVLTQICHPSGYQDVKDWFRSLLLRGESAPEILVPALVDYELRRTLSEREASAGLSRLDSLVQSVTVVPVSAEIGRRAVQISARLRAEKRAPVSDVDALIAATALTEDAVLVTSDADFQAIPGLTVRKWNEVETRA
jgi:predicted nucleic acid-binding protein